MHTSRRLNSELTFIDKNYHFLSNFYNKKKTLTRTFISEKHK